MPVIRQWTEDDAEVMAAARALSRYYDGDDSTDEDAETWVPGAIRALNATNLREAVALIRELYAYAYYWPSAGKAHGDKVQWRETLERARSTFGGQ
jgi:hypothetical protein